MTAVNTSSVSEVSVLSDISDAEGYIVSICFKNGPPRLIGLELEWILHDRADPWARLDRRRLIEALGPYAPTTLSPDSPHLLLDRGGAVTVEPGGQLEISTAPSASLFELVSATCADVVQLDARLDAAGLVRSDSALDTHRQPDLLLETPRYRAMREMFDRDGPHGRQMMGSTASLQISIDAGQPDRLASRWAAAHALGPVLLAAFANPDRTPARGSRWASPRMQTWLGIDAARSGPVAGGDGADPATDWARHALAAPLICRRRPGEDWTVPGRITFADWIRHPESLSSRDGPAGPPTTADLDYHLSTLFPPVRPRGYLELRYLDAQPGDQWWLPAALLAGLNTDDALLDRAREVCEPVRRRWRQAAQLGLADPPVARAAAALVEVAVRAISSTDLPPAQLTAAVEAVERRFQFKEMP